MKRRSRRPAVQPSRAAKNILANPDEAEAGSQPQTGPNRRSPWAAATDRYRTAQELRTPRLGARFTVTFREGQLLLLLPHGAERRVSSPEFNAAVQALEDGDSEETLRLITANGEYLAGVWADLADAPESCTDEVPVEGESLPPRATALLREARARTRAATQVPHGQPIVLGQSRLEQGPDPDGHEELVREVASLKAQLEALEEAASAHQVRADLAEKALEVSRAKPAKPTPVGSRGDADDAIRAVIEHELEGITGWEHLVPTVRSAASLAGTDPGYSLLKSRQVLEEITRAEWKAIFKRDEVPQRSGFGDLMEDLRDQTGMKSDIWHVQKTLFSVASAGAHNLVGISRARAQLTAAVVAHLLASVTDSGPLRPR